jgi:hypothetical protein
LEQFQQIWFFHFNTCVHGICTILPLLHHFPTSSPLPPISPSGRTYFAFLFSEFV